MTMLRSLNTFPVGIPCAVNFPAIGLHCNSWQFLEITGNSDNSVPQRQLTPEAVAAQGREDAVLS